MEDLTKRYQISTTFKKTVCLPPLNDLYNGYYDQTVVDDIIPIIIKIKGFIFDSTKKITRRKVVLARNGNLLIYTNQNEGFMLDPATVQNENMREDRYWKDGKYETYRLTLKLKFVFGTLNMFLVGEQIQKWKEPLNNFLATKETSSEHENIKVNEHRPLKPSGLSVSNLLRYSDHSSYHSLGTVNSFTSLRTIRERNKFDDSQRLVSINELSMPSEIPSSKITAVDCKNAECDVKSDKSGNSIYSMDSVRRRRRTNSRSRIFSKSRESLKVKEETPFEQMEKKMDQNNGESIMKEAEILDKLKDCFDYNQPPSPPSLAMQNLIISESAEPVSKRFGTFGVWVQKQAKENVSSSNLMKQL